MAANDQPHDREVGETLAELSNSELLAALDSVLVELERRLLHYARSGADILEMADEGLVLSTRTAARLRQGQSAAAHTAGHLQIVGVGGWQPRSTNPSWSDDDRVTRAAPHEDEGGEPGAG
jgi:hypothetical protein